MYMILDAYHAYDTTYTTLRTTKALICSATVYGTPGPVRIRMAGNAPKRGDILCMFIREQTTLYRNVCAY